jgi:hypothetical protein
MVARVRAVGEIVLCSSVPTQLVIGAILGAADGEPEATRNGRCRSC